MIDNVETSENVFSIQKNSRCASIKWKRKRKLDGRDRSEIFWAIVINIADGEITKLTDI